MILTLLGVIVSNDACKHLTYVNANQPSLASKRVISFELFDLSYRRHD